MKSMSNSSYEEHINNELSLLSSNFVVKTYKRADADDWPIFEKGKDVRIQIQWNKKNIYEFIVESDFWRQRNTNKEDREYMRMMAEPKIKSLKNALVKKK
jgi:hypothetical protein